MPGMLQGGEATRLLPRGGGGRSVYARHVVLFLAVGAFFTAARFGPTPAALFTAARFGPTPSKLAAADPIKADPKEPVYETWRSANYATATDVRQMQEHVLNFELLARTTYSNWRTFAMGEIGAATQALGAEGVEVVSRWWGSGESSLFLAALDKREISAGSVIFGSVMALLDTDLYGNELEDRGVSRDVYLHGCIPCADADYDVQNAQIHSQCAYAHSGGSLLDHSAFLRALLGYEDPLLLVLANDGACKLTDLPVTHHRIILGNEASAEQVDALREAGVDAWSWPMGFEGLLDDASESYDGAAPAIADFLAAIQTTRDQPTDRDVLLSYSGSTIFRKPSRVALGNWVVSGGGADALKALAADASEAGFLWKISLSSWGLKVRVEEQGDGDYADAVEWAVGGVETETENGEYALSTQSAFILAPAGDLWMSGRVIEALVLGAIPVVDETYITDGGDSSKGCGDAALFWRRMSADEQGAGPLVFVRDWTLLPETLVSSGALYASQRAERLAALPGVVRRIAASIRDPILDFVPRPFSSCKTLDFDVKSYLDAAAAYYLQSGDGPYPWFDSFQDSASLPSPQCSKKAVRPSDEPLCFDANCIVPSACGFQCS
ncbi:hypothetical protein M885DRAFT_610401 [Pelagophyceae sp. CCMP2097]|nr:hypothetical protein M885DRAFT_610401 [Pelagophyceae sp. CCMP2097]